MGEKYQIIYTEGMWICRLTLLKHIQIFIFKEPHRPFVCVERIAPCVYIRFGYVSFSYLYMREFSSYFSLEFRAMKQKVIWNFNFIMEDKKMKILRPERIRELCTKRAMFPADWCQAQLNYCEEQAKGMVEITPREANEIMNVIAEKDGSCPKCNNILAKLKPIAERGRNNVPSQDKSCGF